MCCLVFVTLAVAEGGNVSESVKPFPVADLEFFESRVRPLLIEHCYECHSGDAEKVQAGLLMDHRQQLVVGGESGPAVVAGDPDNSLLIQSVRYDASEMPPDKKLSGEQIADLEKWITLGAPWPMGAVAAPQELDREKNDWDKLRQSHWAWRPVERPKLPSVADDARVSNAIDLFVEQGREQHGLSAADGADRLTMIRRLYFDLLGVPPTPEQIDRFQRNRSAHAYEELVDELLALPAYGERWGRHWLDVARYNDGGGSFNDSGDLPEAYRYRDWVVQRLNQDQPFDEFIRHQVAGDLLGDRDDAIGTGFFAIGPTYRSDGGDPDSVAQAKSETLDDRVDTMSRAFLGITVACARCHDHKFDPVPTLDYYSLAGVFNNSRSLKVPLASQSEIDSFNAMQNAIKQLDQQVKEIDQRAKKEKRDLTIAEKRERESKQAELKHMRDNAPQRYAEFHGLGEGGTEDMRVALRGNLRKPGPVAPRRFLHVLSRSEPKSFANGSGRQELAKEIASVENPLTARVIVNRLWQHHFGIGIVSTASNFGTLGERPTHPELLDWLASELTQNDWSLKKIHRMILLSTTYRMSSDYDAKSFAIDGGNRFLWRFNPRRLDVESWRDAILFVTGELDATIGGPPASQLFVSRRRTLYAKISRSGDQFHYDEFLRNFDFPTPRGSHATRSSSIVPQQFLFMMNSPFMADRAKALARRLELETNDSESRIRRAYNLLYGRPAKPREIELGLRFLTMERAGSDPQNADSQLSIGQQYAQALLSSNEFMYIR
ncbi:PSD1 and planctomycete cytochrome C domain-containing protein [Planctomycetota bacterium]